MQDKGRQLGKTQVVPWYYPCLGHGTHTQEPDLVGEDTLSVLPR